MISTTTDVLLSISNRIELSILFKATVLLVAGLAAARIAAGARASTRHVLLALTLGALLLLPVVIAAAPPLSIALAVPAALTQAVAIDGSPASVPPGSAGSSPRPAPAAINARPGPVSFSTAVRGVWLAGAAGVSTWLLIAWRQIARLRRTALPRRDLHEQVRTLADRAGVRRRIDVLEHEATLTPLTCGVIRPAILLPPDARDWSDADVERALVHELEHIRRRDWLTQMAARLACALYWFHPLAWMALHRLGLEAERACDDAVAGMAERTDYADQLVSLARRLSAAQVPVMLGMASRSDLSARVDALLDDRQPRGRTGIATILTAVLVSAVGITSLGSVRAVAATPAAGAPQQSADAASRRARAIDKALYEAARSGDIDDVDDLLRAGANLDAAIRGDGSPLMGAVRSGSIALVQHLLERGADVNLAVTGDGTALIVAADDGQTRIVELLLDRGASIDTIVPGDETALIQASGEGHLETVKLLVGRGANVNLGMWVESSARDREWRSPLSMARMRGRTAVVEFLTAAGARE